MSVEHTLAIIFPEGMTNVKKIIKILKEQCFTILSQRYIHLTPEQASDFYHDLYGRRDFPLLVAYMSSAPVTVVCLGREDAVEKLVEIVGPRDVVVAQRDNPRSLNSQFGNYECNLPAMHASRNLPIARREILFFFPNSLLEPIPNLETGLNLLDKEVRPLLKEGLAQLVKEKPLEPMLWLADWLLAHNRSKPLVPSHLRRQPFPEGGVK